MSENETYATNDFYLSAFLKAKGLKIIRLERNKGHTTFVFRNRDNRKKLVEEFYANASVEVNVYTHAIRDLKAMIYNLKE